MKAPILEVKNLRVGFKEQNGPIVDVVRGMSLAIPEGSFFGLAGESGCGKSVFAMAITGLPPTDDAIRSGSILFRGTEILNLDREKMRAFRGKNGFSHIFQDAVSALNPVMRIGPQLEEACCAGGILPVEMLAEAGLPPEIMNAYPHELSGGMAQRVCIAMAMLSEPSFLIADEPTTALDPIVQKQILELLDRMRKISGATVLFITHNLGLIARFADFCAVMYAGRTVEYGPAADVLTAPLHPYTAGLLNAVPKLNGKNSASLHGIPGVVPPPTQWGTGCIFAPRCSEARDVCFKMQPEGSVYSDRHICECHFPNNTRQRRQTHDFSFAGNPVIE